MLSTRTRPQDIHGRGKGAAKIDSDKRHKTIQGFIRVVPIAEGRAAPTVLRCAGNSRPGRTTCPPSCVCASAHVRVCVPVCSCVLRAQVTVIAFVGAQGDGPGGPGADGGAPMRRRPGRISSRGLHSEASVRPGIRIHPSPSESIQDLPSRLSMTLASAAAPPKVPSRRRRRRRRRLAAAPDDPSACQGPGRYLPRAAADIRQPRKSAAGERGGGGREAQTRRAAATAPELPMWSRDGLLRHRRGPYGLPGSCSGPNLKLRRAARAPRAAAAAAAAAASEDPP